MRHEASQVLRSSISAIALIAAAVSALPALAAERQQERERQSGDGALDDGAIVVTAQRRSELLEEVPMAVTVVSSETIENANVNNFMDLGKIAVGTQLDFAGSVPGISVRGISSVIAGYNIEPNVAVYFDGIYDPQPVTMLADLANIESIQVLKGPQGTLYGRNATGGAVLVNSLGPSEFNTGKFEVSYGNFDRVSVSGYAAGPISDRVRYSVSGYYRHGDLSLRKADPNVIGGTDGAADTFEYRNVRLKLEGDLSDSVTATIGFTHSKTDDNRANYFSTYAHQPATYPPPPASATRLGVVANDFPTNFIAKKNEVSFKLEADLPIGKLTSISAYTHRRFTVDLDFDGTYVPAVGLEIDYKERTWQQTVDLTIDSIENLVVNVGGTYYDDALRQSPDLGFYTYVGANAVQLIRFNGFSKAWALYADGTYDLTDKLSVTLGGRYSYDKKRANYIATTPDGSFTITPFTENERSWKEFTPRATLRYEVAPRANVYASVSRGYRAGAFSASGPVAGEFDPAEPETMTAYEVGFKWVRPRLRVSAAAFYYDYKDLQTSVTIPAAGGSVQSSLRNAKGAKVKGAEAEITVEPIDNLTLRAAVAVVDAYFTTFPNAVGTGVNATNTLNIGNQQQDWSGHELSRAPNYSGNAGFDYKIPSEVGTFLLTGNVSFTSSYVLANNSLYGPEAPLELRDKQRFRQSGYALLSAQLSWTDPTDHWTAAVFGDNLTDKRHLLTANGASFGDYSPTAEPRTYGVKLGYKF